MTHYGLKILDADDNMDSFLGSILQKVFDIDRYSSMQRLFEYFYYPIS